MAQDEMTQPESSTPASPPAWSGPGGRAPWMPAVSPPPQTAPADVPSPADQGGAIRWLTEEVRRLRSELESLPHHMALHNPAALEEKNRREGEAEAAKADAAANVPTQDEFSQDELLILRKLMQRAQPPA